MDLGGQVISQSKIFPNQQATIMAIMCPEIVKMWATMGFTILGLMFMWVILSQYLPIWSPALL